MSLTTTPLRLIAVVLIYMLILVGVSAGIIYWTLSTQPGSSRPLRTHPPTPIAALDEPQPA